MSFLISNDEKLVNLIQIYQNIKLQVMLAKRVALSHTLTNLFPGKMHITQRTTLPTFSTNKPQQNQSTKNSSQQPNQQQQIRFQRIRQQKLKQLQQQQIKDMNDRVYLTKGSYNPLIEYMKLHKGVFVGLGVALVLGFYGWRVWAMSGIYNVEELDKRYQQVDGVTIYKYQYLGIKKLKKFSIISEKYQQQNLAQPINNLFLNIYSPLPKQQITTSMSNKIASLEKKLSSYFKNQIKVTPISTEEPITLALPNNNILISKSILRTGKFSQFQLEFLLLLNQQLFKQGYHLRTLSLSQLPTFFNTSSASNQIKLRQIYSRKYKRNQILDTIHLIKYKLGTLQNSQQNLEIDQLFQKLKILNQQLNKGKETVCEQNIFQRLYKYYIFVKIQ